MIYNTSNIGGFLISDNSFYTIRHNHDLEDITVISGELYINKATRGHLHHHNEEVYIFTEGTGELRLTYPDEGQGETGQEIQVSPGTIVLIEKSVVHRVHNTGTSTLKWVSVFNGVKKSPFVADTSTVYKWHDNSYGTYSWLLESAFKRKMKE
jgi:mannose-6-phosphate isomerase-like protein (cupin superfamily)